VHLASVNIDGRPVHKWNIPLRAPGERQRRPVRHFQCRHCHRLLRCRCLLSQPDYNRCHHDMHDHDQPCTDWDCGFQWLRRRDRGHPESMHSLERNLLSNLRACFQHGGKSDYHRNIQRRWFGNNHPRNRVLHNHDGFLLPIPRQRRCLRDVHGDRHQRGLGLQHQGNWYRHLQRHPTVGDAYQLHFVWWHMLCYVDSRIQHRRKLFDICFLSRRHDSRLELQQRHRSIHPDRNYDYIQLLSIIDLLHRVHHVYCDRIQY